MIEAQRLSKRYGDKVAVDDLSFTVRPGVVTGFLGPNGAGKSTTMRLILGLDAPSAGRVTVNGKQFAEHAAVVVRPGQVAVVQRAGGQPRPLAVHLPADQAAAHQQHHPAVPVVGAGVAVLLYAPAEFAERLGWKNDPEKAHWLSLGQSAPGQ